MTRRRFYDGQHGFYAGIGRHARRRHPSALGANGKVIKGVNIAATRQSCLVQPGANTIERHCGGAGRRRDTPRSQSHDSRGLSQLLGRVFFS
jgi:hypothetical protein